MNKYLSFETERLLLRPTSEDDAELILNLLNTPKWLEFIGDRNVHSKEEAIHYIQTKMKPQLVKLGFSNYTIIRKHDHLKIGVCGLYQRHGLDGIDIGFALLANYEGKGYAYEAASRIKKAAKEEFKLTHLNAITTKENFASRKLIEKLGLNFKQTVILPDTEEELLLFDTAL